MSATGLVDAMAHLDDARVVDPAALLDDAAGHGITDVVNAGVDPAAPAFAARHPRVRVHAATGLHPLVVDAARVDDQLAALDAASARVGIVAVGECGLDARPHAPPMEAQRRALEGALACARARALPLIFHVVRAHPVFLEVLARHPPVRGVVHGFTGAPELALALVARGLHVSFGGLVASPKVVRGRRAAAAVPAERLLVESDTPDHPHPGETGSAPSSIVRTLHALAELRGVAFAEVAATTAANARALYGLS